MKKIITLLLCLVSALCLCTSCRKKNENTIVIGTMEIPGQIIIDYIKPEFEKRGYELDIKIYSEFSMPNVALEEGSIDVNLFQHTTYLNTYNQANGSLALYGHRIRFPPARLPSLFLSFQYHHHWQ